MKKHKKCCNCLKIFKTIENLPHSVVFTAMYKLNMRNSKNKRKGNEVDKRHERQIDD